MNKRLEPFKLSIAEVPFVKGIMKRLKIKRLPSCIQRCPSKGLSASSQRGEKRALIVAFAKFPGVNTPNRPDFKLLT